MPPHRNLVGVSKKRGRKKRLLFVDTVKADTVGRVESCDFSLPRKYVQSL